MLGRTYVSHGRDQLFYFMFIMVAMQPPSRVPTKTTYNSSRMINAGMDASAHLIMNMTMEPKGILMSTT